MVRPLVMRYAGVVEIWAVTDNHASYRLPDARPMGKGVVAKGTAEVAGDVVGIVIRQADGVVLGQMPVTGIGYVHKHGEVEITMTMDGDYLWVVSYQPQLPFKSD